MRCPRHCRARFCRPPTRRNDYRRHARIRRAAEPPRGSSRRMRPLRWHLEDYDVGYVSRGPSATNCGQRSNGAWHALRFDWIRRVLCLCVGGIQLAVGAMRGNGLHGCIAQAIKLNSRLPWGSPENRDDGLLSHHSLMLAAMCPEACYPIKIQMPLSNHVGCPVGCYKSIVPIEWRGWILRHCRILGIPHTDPLRQQPDCSAGTRLGQALVGSTLSA